MERQLVIYEKPTCSTCRQLVKLLQERGVDFEKVNYYIDPISEEKLRELLAKMQISPRELLRTREALYSKLELSSDKLSDDDIIKLMVENPDLIQRPIVENGDKAVLARPIETVNRLFSK